MKKLLLTLLITQYLLANKDVELYTGGENFTSYIGPISLTTRGKFLSQLTNFNTNDLESEATTSHILHFGSAGNANVSTYASRYFGGCESDLSKYSRIDDTASNDDFWTTSGTKFFASNCYNTFNFTKPISAFGFYGLDGLRGDYTFLYIDHVDGSFSNFVISRTKDMNFNFIYTDESERYPTNFIGVVTRTSGKAIKSISIKVRYKGFWDVGYPDTVDSDAKFDDFVVAGLGYIRDGDMDGDGVVNSKDAFPTNSSESVDTDYDGIGNNTDKDDDGDGIPDIVEKYYDLNPLDSRDAGKDGDGDGFSNVIEIELGFNPYSSNSHPKWAPILMNDIIIFIPYK